MRVSDTAQTIRLSEKQGLARPSAIGLPGRRTDRLSGRKGELDLPAQSLVLSPGRPERTGEKRACTSS